MSLHPIAAGRPSRLLCVFAHPDDEVFCAGGLLASWAAAHDEATVVSATRGEAGQIRDANVATRATLGAIRERELREACAALGVRRVRCLDHRDGTLHMLSREALATEIATLIRECGAGVIVTFGPDGGYGHPDHIAVSVATTRACQLIRAAGERAPDLYYSAFPLQHRHLCRELATWLSECPGEFQGSAAFVQGLSLLAGEAALLHYVDDTAATQWFPDGCAIIEQGERAGNLYLIVAGDARVVTEDARGRQRVLRMLRSGQFFGAEALARGTTQAASVIAEGVVTCLVIAPKAPTAFAGRGADAQAEIAAPAHADDCGPGRTRLLAVEASAHAERKIAALAAHRSQFAFDPAAFPRGVLRALLGSEYFERARMPSKALRSQEQDAFPRAVRRLAGASA